MRAGCPEEGEPQSAYSPGVVGNGEMVVFGLIYPEAANQESLAQFEKGKMRSKSVSICRSAHSTYGELLDKVVAPQLTKPHRKYLGFQIASCEEIRSIMIPTKNGVDTDKGAVCVIDDGYEGYIGHARMGFAEHDPDFWKRNNREAARGNLAIVLRRRGTFNDHAAWP